MKTPTRKNLPAFLLLTLLLPACNKTETPIPPGSPTSPNPAAPNANAPASGHSFSLATNGTNLATVKNPQWLHPQFAITPDDVDTPVLFGTIVNEEKKLSAPVILKKFGNLWKIIELSDAPNLEWVYAGACPPRKELWGILDANDSQDAPQLLLMRSTDSGAIWQYFSAVKKISSNAGYAGFSMSKAGVARLTTHLADDEENIPKGYYHYSTVDGGKTWTGPTYEPDDTSESEPMSDQKTMQDAINSIEKPEPAAPATPGAPQP